MTTDQTTVFILLLLVFVLLIWGRWRYDLVAFSALMAAVATGVVPPGQAFSGFGHPAVVVVALVLIVSRALSNSGVIEFLARYLVDSTRKLSAHICIMAGFAAPPPPTIRRDGLGAPTCTAGSNSLTASCTLRAVKATNVAMR